MKITPIGKSKNTSRIFLILAAVVLVFTLCFYFFSVVNNLDKKIKVSQEANLLPPAFSRNAGFYEQEFDLVLKKNHPDDIIYFTLDGSKPTFESFEYSQPIKIRNREAEADFLTKIPNSPMWVAPHQPVFKGTVVRAMIVRGSGMSKIATNSYFVSEKGRARYSLPVVSISVNFEDFFGHERGIYVMGKSFYNKSFYLNNEVDENTNWRLFPSNYRRRGINWERPVYIEYFDQAPGKGFEAYGGIRIHGAITRANNQKSFRIVFNPDYGTPELNYDFFRGTAITRLNAFLLRSSGSDQNNTMFRDAFLQSLLDSTKLDRQAYQPSVLFLNGEYWGIYNIRERLDENTLATRHGLRPDSIQIITPAPELKKDFENPDKRFKNLLNFLQKNDLSIQANFDSLSGMIDMDNLTDYLVVQLYYANSDWPNNNIRMWRYNTPVNLAAAPNSGDGRWRFLLYDLDRSFKDPAERAVSWLTRSETFTGLLFRAILKNEKYKADFFKRFDYHIANTFETRRVIRMIDRKQQGIAAEMPEHIKRWRAISSMQVWNEQVEVLRNFARLRPATVRKELETLKAKLETPAAK